MALVTPRTWIPGTDYGTAPNLQTVSDSVLQLQGRTPTIGGALDFAILRQTVVQSIATSTWTSILLDVEDVDSANSHNTVTNTSRFTAVTPGYFQANASVTFGANATGVRGIRFLINGTTVVQSPVVLPTGASAIYLSLSKLVILTAGSYVEVQGYQNSGGALNTTYLVNDNGCAMDAHWVHA